MEKSAFIERLSSLIQQVSKVNPSTLPHVPAKETAALQMQGEQSRYLFMGTLLTTLCCGAPHNVQAPQANTPQSIDNIKGALRWALSCLKDDFTPVTRSIANLDDWYGDMLYEQFSSVQFTTLVGIIAATDIDIFLSDKSIIEWSAVTAINLLAYCAIREIDPFE